MSENLKAQEGTVNAKYWAVRHLGYWFSSFILVAGLTTVAPQMEARNKKPATPAAKDEIEVIGHIPLTDGPVRRFLSTRHYSSYYLYAEHDAGHNATLIDVTKTNQPSVLTAVSYAPSNTSDNLAVVAGTAALVTSERTAPTPAAEPQTVRIMDFSNPQNPRVAREFTGVTAMSRDERRGLIFVANQDGIWILEQHLAQDPEVERAYANYVLYSH